MFIHPKSFAFVKQHIKKGGVIMKTSTKVLLMIMCLFLTTGCAKSQVIESETTLEESPESFPNSYKGSPLSKMPLTWRGAYDTGTYFFVHGNYEPALEHFLKGAELSEGERKLTSLVAAAVCALAMDNNDKYLEIMDMLKASKDEESFKEPTTTNNAFEVLQEIKR
jgi:hypothetical protein